MSGIIGLVVILAMGVMGLLKWLTPDVDSVVETIRDAKKIQAAISAEFEE